MAQPDVNVKGFTLAQKMVGKAEEGFIFNLVGFRALGFRVLGV